MFSVHAGNAFHAPVLAHGATSVQRRSAGYRPLVFLASGRRNGPITRLITPWDVAELTTPFESLEYAERLSVGAPAVGLPPHPGIAALTIVLSGRMSFRDPSGRQGELSAGGFAWTSWAHPLLLGEWASQEAIRVLHLWISLTSAQQDSPIVSTAFSSHEVEHEGPVRVILGQFGHARSPLRNASADLNCFHVCLRDGQRWRYDPPEGHNVTWIAVDRGGLEFQRGERARWEQIAVFGHSKGVIEAHADGDTSFVLGSAPRHLHRPERR